MTQTRTREFEFTMKDFNFLRGFSNSKTGIVVADDKFDMFYSRLARRVRILKLKNFAEYCDYVKKHGDKGENTELVNAVTTNLTSFFREKHHFDFLRDTAIPDRMTLNRASKKIDIWSAGCSTGEEPYSIAMTLNEMKSQLIGWDAHISATDIDSNVVATASTGVYAMDRVKDLPQSQLKKWFKKGTGGQAGKVRVSPDLQKDIEFGLLNLMQNWKKESQDIIFCRNVIIYFDKETKHKLVNRFADTLKPGGYLFIGHSETLQHLGDRLELIGNTVYRKVG